MTGPPYTTHVGRPIHDLVVVYKEQCTKKLAQHTKLTDSIYITSFQGLNLCEYIQGRSYYCINTHTNCVECPSMLCVANKVLHGGYITLKSAFTESFPSAQYNVTYARRRLLQIPLACIRVDYPPGVSECFLIEYYPSTNYNSIQALIKNIVQKSSSSNSDSISKDVVKSLLSLCRSDRERECLQYTVFKASGLSATQVCKRYGFQSMSKRSEVVEDTIRHARYIRKSIDELAKTRDQSMLKALGISAAVDNGSSTDESTDDEESRDDWTESKQHMDETLQYDPPTLAEITRSSLFNFFEIVERLRNCRISHSSLLGGSA